ncbi:MAG: hypothetical protein AAF639_09615 [Chloroflexota bacterium]
MARKLKRRAKKLSEKKSLAKSTPRKPPTEQEVAELASLFIRWVEITDWDRSQAFLTDNATAMLTDVGESTLGMFLRLTEEQDAQDEMARRLQLHVTLLQRCREDGIQAAYDVLRMELRDVEEHMSDPVIQTVASFIRAEDDEAACQLFEENRDVLMLDQAQLIIYELLGYARKAGDIAMETQLLARLTLLGYLTTT